MGLSGSEDARPSPRGGLLREGDQRALDGVQALQVQTQRVQLPRRPRARAEPPPVRRGALPAGGVRGGTVHEGAVRAQGVRHGAARGDVRRGVEGAVLRAVPSRRGLRERGALQRAASVSLLSLLPLAHTLLMEARSSAPLRCR
jgi:hypothetical protein